MSEEKLTSNRVAIVERAKSIDDNNNFEPNTPQQGNYELALKDFDQSQLSYRDKESNYNEMTLKLNYLRRLEQQENERIEVTRQRIKKIMGIRKQLQSREKLREKLMVNKEMEYQKKLEKAKEIKEREKLSYMSIKLHHSQKSKDYVNLAREHTNEIKMKKYQIEKDMYDVNREKRERVRAMTQDGKQKIKAFNNYHKRMVEKEKNKDKSFSNELHGKKDEQIHKVLNETEQVMERINAIREIRTNLKHQYDNMIYANDKFKFNTLAAIEPRSVKPITEDED